VRDLSPFDSDVTLRLSIGAELCIVWVAFLRPRLGWPLIFMIYGVFVAILLQLVAIGAESCGCGGESIKIAPWMMLSIDGSLLLFLLAMRPWSAIAARGGPLALVGVLAAASVAAPWMLIPSMAEGPPSAGANPDDGAAVPEWSLPDPLPRYEVLEPSEWVDKDLYETRLATWIRPEELPTDGFLVFYRTTCDHCAEHLEQMAAEDFGMPTLLLRIVEDTDNEENKVTHVMPEGPHVTHMEMPRVVEYVIETPWTLELMGGVVTSAKGR